MTKAISVKITILVITTWLQGNFDRSTTASTRNYDCSLPWKSYEQPHARPCNLHGVLEQRGVVACLLEDPIQLRNFRGGGHSYPARN
jgi:hypothetical protein